MSAVLVPIARARPDLAEAYAGAYAAAAGSGRDDIMAWLPVVAAARLAEGVPGAEAALLALVDAPGSFSSGTTAPRRIFPVPPPAAAC